MSHRHLDLWLEVIVDNTPARDAFLDGLIFELWLLGSEEEESPT
jgi:hypothetical protein